MENPFEKLQLHLDKIESLINDLSINVGTNSTAKILDDKKPLKLKEAALFLGLAPTSLYGLIQKGKLVPLKPGKHLLFTREGLEAYLRGETPKQQDKIEPSIFLTRNKKARS